MGGLAMRFFLSFSAAILLMVATWFLYTGFSIETTVPASPEASEILSAGAQGISNLQLMHIQLIDIIIGLVAGLGSCVLYSAAAIVAAIERPVAEN
jgi:uncharacterized membrane protein